MKKSTKHSFKFRIVIPKYGIYYCEKFGENNRIAYNCIAVSSLNNNTYEFPIFRDFSKIPHLLEILNVAVELECRQ